MDATTTNGSTEQAPHSAPRDGARPHPTPATSTPSSSENLVMVQRQMGHHHISRSYFRQTDIKRSGNASIDIMSKFFKLMVVLQLMNDLNEVFKMPLSLVLRLVNSIFDIVCGLPVRFFPSISCDLSVRRLIVCLRFFDLSIIPLRYWNKRF
uniref:Uncharacterized protein n=1 Tax=Zea mays TaxID=4577 RepID=A0A804QZ20_MAIZE